MYQGEFQIKVSIGYAKVYWSIGNLGEIFKEADYSMYAQNKRNMVRSILYVPIGKKSLSHEFLNL